MPDRIVEPVFVVWEFHHQGSLSEVCLSERLAVGQFASDEIATSCIFEVHILEVILT
jgi:hypothetical protein